MKSAVALGVLLATVSVSNAISLNYQIGAGSHVEANAVDLGLRLKTEISSSLSGSAFTLNDGQSATFQFFKIWADEASVESDDLAKKPILATIDFSAPSADANFTGVTFGANINFLYDKAILTWDAPALVSVSDRTFSVSLSNLEFSKGSLFDADLGDASKSKWVIATVTQIASTSSIRVPDGGTTAALLGLGIAGLACVRRRN